MQGAARLFFTLAIIYALAGMALGIHMGISGDHGEMPTHAHIMLAGWVTSALVAYFYHLFPQAGASALAMVHFIAQTAGAIVMMVSLWFIYSGHTGFEAGAGIGSIVFALAMALFAYISLREVWKA
jgi:VIT1/CCC1 family predicted Fe2+/Mn2+ transporter